MDVRFQTSAVREYQLVRRHYSDIDPNVADRFRSAVDLVLAASWPIPTRYLKSGAAFAGFASGGFPTSSSSNGSMRKRSASMPSLTRVVVPATGEDGE